jgi:hypothetical protein
MQVVIFLVVAVVAVAVTLVMLLITKIPAIVAIGAAVTSALLTVVYARIDLGYWDPFTPIAFVTTMAYALVVSFIALWIGRKRKWPLFVKSP